MVARFAWKVWLHRRELSHPTALSTMDIDDMIDRCRSVSHFSPTASGTRLHLSTTANLCFSLSLNYAYNNIMEKETSASLISAGGSEKCEVIHADRTCCAGLSPDALSSGDTNLVCLQEEWNLQKRHLSHLERPPGCPKFGPANPFLPTPLTTESHGALDIAKAKKLTSMDQVEDRKSRQHENKFSKNSDQKRKQTTSTLSPAWEFMKRASKKAKILEPGGRNDSDLTKDSDDEWDSDSPQKSLS